jgi:hypothetical protein
VFEAFGIGERDPAGAGWHPRIVAGNYSPSVRLV